MLVYKYRSEVIENDTHRDIISFTKEEIYAPRIKQLNDPYEVEYLDGFRVMANAGNAFRSMQNQNVERVEITDPHIDLLQKYCGIYSLSVDNNDFPSNELMWAHYANAHKGFCIAYDWDELKAYFEQEEDVLPIIVQYKDSPPIINGGDENSRLEKVLGTKSKQWEYEHEVRLVFKQLDNFFRNRYYCPSRLVKAIYLGMNMEPASKAMLVEYCKKTRIPVFQMQHPKYSYQLKATNI